MIIESRLSLDLAGGFLGGFFLGMVKQNGQKSDSIDEKRKTVHFQTHFNNAYKRSRPYAICDMHYKCILLRTYYGSDPNPCIMSKSTVIDKGRAVAFWHIMISGGLHKSWAG